MDSSKTNNNALLLDIETVAAVPSERTTLLSKPSFDSSFSGNNNNNREKKNRRHLCWLVLIFVLLLYLARLEVSREKQMIRSYYNDGGSREENQWMSMSVLRNPTLSPAARQQPALFLSLVLLPPEGGEVETRIQGQIDRFAETNGGPSFPAHVTVVGGFTCQNEDEAYQIARRLENLAGAFGAIPCRFRSRPERFERSWSQALVLPMEGISDEFVQLCETSRYLLDLPLSGCTNFPPPVKRPHMSLFYGTENIPDPAIVDPTIPTSFEGTRVALWITTPSTLEGVPKWKQIDVIYL